MSDGLLLFRCGPALYAVDLKAVVEIVSVDADVERSPRSSDLSLLWSARPHDSSAETVRLIVRAGSGASGVFSLLADPLDVAVAPSHELRVPTPLRPWLPAAVTGVLSTDAGFACRLSAEVLAEVLR